MLLYMREKNKKSAEQAAALVCLSALGLNATHAGHKELLETKACTKDELSISCKMVCGDNSSNNQQFLETNYCISLSHKQSEHCNTSVPDKEKSIV